MSLRISTERPSRRHGWRIALVTTLVLACFEAAASDSTTEPEAGSTIAIGGLFSLTGNWATLGVTSKAAMEIGIGRPRRHE